MALFHEAWLIGHASTGEYIPTLVLIEPNEKGQLLLHLHSDEDRDRGGVHLFTVALGDLKKVAL